MIQNLRRAREAYERREWVSVHQALSGLSDIELEPDDFVALATAAFLLGRTNDVVQAPTAEPVSVFPLSVRERSGGVGRSERFRPQP